MVPILGDARFDSPSVSVRHGLLALVNGAPAALHSRLQKSGADEHVFANTTARETPTVRCCTCQV